MIKAVFDTNIFVSAILRPNSITAELINLASKGHFELCISSQIINELDTVLHCPRIQKKYKLPEETINVYLGFILETSVNVGHVPELFVVPNDPKDNHIVSTALVCKADYLVTGDKAHVLSLGKVETVKIVSVRDFYEVGKEK
jgi:putative PIN family toxin of toxin-antitoxin system